MNILGCYLALNLSEFVQDTQSGVNSNETSKGYDGTQKALVFDDIDLYYTKNHYRNAPWRIFLNSWERGWLKYVTLPDF